MLFLEMFSSNFFNYKCFVILSRSSTRQFQDDDIKWKHFPRNWPFVRGIHRSPVNSPHKGQWRGALMFSLICVWISDWVNNREAGDLRRYRAHYDVIVMFSRRSLMALQMLTRRDRVTLFGIIHTISNISCNYHDPLEFPSFHWY